MAKKIKGYFSDISIGRSDLEARMVAKNWETIYPNKYKVKNLKLIKKPNWIQEYLLFGSGFYVYSFDVYEL